MRPCECLLMKGILRVGERGGQSGLGTRTTQNEGYVDLGPHLLLCLFFPLVPVV